MIDPMPNGAIKPNFFIVGAPRCGTTALSAYLAEHPRIGFSKPKETQFFCTDLPGIHFHTSDQDEYLDLCFGHCTGKNYLAVGEGSVWNLYSRDAVANILRLNTNARFIIMVRNPIDLCVALYEKRREMLQEDQPSFEKAWRVEDQRDQGRSIPTLFRKEIGVPGYRNVASLGEQVEKAFALIPERQRLLIVFDDFAANTAAVYAQVLAFLGVPHDGRKDFPQINEGRQIRNVKLWALVWGTLLHAHPLVDPVKRVLKVSTLDIYPRLSRLFLSSRSQKPPISDALRAEMRAFFDEDIKRLSAAIGRDLTVWS
jgi:Sulfotransferase domain